MRAWIQDVGEDAVAFVHGVSGEDLDSLATYCREKGEAHKASVEMKHAMSVDGTVIMDWCNKRGVTWSQFMNDTQLQTRFIDDPDNAPFRIWKGRM